MQKKIGELNAKCILLKQRKSAGTNTGQDGIGGGWSKVLMV